MRLASIFAACLLSAAATTPGFAADAVSMPGATNTISGYGEFYAGYGWGSDNDPQDWNYVPYGGALRVNAWLTPTWNLQADGWINHYHASDYDYDYNAGGGALHLGMRTSGYYVGGLVSYGSNEDMGSNAYSVAVEAQRYLDKVTLYGQAGYSATTTGLDGDAWYARGVGRYFVDPNLMLEANAGFASEQLDYFGTLGNDQTSWGVKIEWKPKDTLPLSFYGAYQGHHDSWSDGYRLTSHSIMAGARVMFGQSTLKDNDRNGASLADFNPAYGVYEPWEAY